MAGLVPQFLIEVLSFMDSGSATSRGSILIFQLVVRFFQKFVNSNFLVCAVLLPLTAYETYRTLFFVGS